jgi:DNA-binding response OmpR family regulator
VTSVVSDPTAPGTRPDTRSVLVIDDDPDIQLVLDFALEDAGYQPLPAATGEAGLLIATETPPDATLVDLRLPGLPGLDLIPTLRATSPMPILVITAQTAGPDTTTALRLGADDYLTKPFAPRDLLHRISTQLTTPTLPDQTAGRLCADPDHGRLLLDGEPLALTCTERRLLTALAAADGKSLGPNELLREVWGYRSPGDHTVVTSMITRLQARLTAAGGTDVVIHGAHGTWRINLAPAAPVTLAR